MTTSTTHLPPTHADLLVTDMLVASVPLEMLAKNGAGFLTECSATEVGERQTVVQQPFSPEVFR